MTDQRLSCHNYDFRIREGKVFVKGEDQIYLGDVISLELTLTRINNLIKNQAQFVHSLKYP